MNLCQDFKIVNQVLIEQQWMFKDFPLFTSISMTYKSINIEIKEGTWFQKDQDQCFLNI